MEVGRVRLKRGKVGYLSAPVFQPSVAIFLSTFLRFSISFASRKHIWAKEMWRWLSQLTFFLPRSSLASKCLLATTTPHCYVSNLEIIIRQQWPESQTLRVNGGHCLYRKVLPFPIGRVNASGVSWGEFAVYPQSKLPKGSSSNNRKGVRSRMSSAETTHPKPTPTGTSEYALLWVFEKT